MPQLSGAELDDLIWRAKHYGVAASLLLFLPVVAIFLRGILYPIILLTFGLAVLVFFVRRRLEETWHERRLVVEARGATDEAKDSLASAQGFRVLLLALTEQLLYGLFAAAVLVFFYLHYLAGRP